MQTVIIFLSQYISRRLRQLTGLPLRMKEINFTITKQENLGHQHIGFDRFKRRLLLVRRRKNKFVCCIVNLRDLQWCSVKKVYSPINAGELNQKGLHHHLQHISLQLGFKGRSKPLTVAFFESEKHQTEELPLLEAAANRWRNLLSQLVPKAPAAIAA